MSWELENTEIRMLRGKLEKGSVGEHINFRANPYYFRKLEEILASQINPLYKTVSDCLRDALADWVEKFLNDNDVKDLELYNDFMRYKKREKIMELVDRREQDERFILTLEDQIKRAFQEKDQHYLTELKELGGEMATISYDVVYRERLLKVVNDYNL